MIKFFLLLFICIVSLGFAQEIAKIEVEIPELSFGFDIPVNVNLDNIAFVSDSILSLVEVQGKTRIPIPFQIEKSEHRTLYWLLKPKNLKQKKFIFELVKKEPKQFPKIKLNVTDSALIIHTENQNLLQYNYKTVYPPAGIDTIFKRSGFIHPLRTPRGQTLTRIQPPDHYHHYGIWNPWARVLFKGDTIDFWNLHGRKGTVRFANFASTTSGTVFSEFQTLHEHIVFYKNGIEEIALNELQTIRVYHPEKNQDYYIADFTFQMNCATEQPITLLEYRYGGLGWRATEEWNNDNSEIFTSENKMRKDADGSFVRWCVVQGIIGNDFGGVVLMSHPSNYNHPEPLRVWTPENQNGRGDVFINFSPTKNKDWLLEPGRKYELRYRLIVYDGMMSGETAESVWKNFSVSPKIEIKSQQH